MKRSLLHVYLNTLWLTAFIFFTLWGTQVHAAEGSATIIFTGDVVLDGTPGKLIASGKDPFAPFAGALQKADFRVMNLECVVAHSGSAADKTFTFRAHPQTLTTLKRYANAVSVANNHSGDFGHVAFSEMLTLLDQQQILYFGGGNNLQQAHQPLIVTLKGIRIAFLGYNEFMPRSFEAGPKSPGVAWSEDEQVIKDIQTAKKQYMADIVIPFMHWGWENDKVAVPRQRHLARLMIDAGADAVIGGHPHVTQDVEQYRGKPVIYSLGNFMIDELDNEPQTRGWIVQLTVDKKGVSAWTSLQANIAEDGVPTPAPRLLTPCWHRGDNDIQQCRGLD
ncbi:CapA family protein [Undibacterium sp. SXout7W]|uniref:CapA family protein n=1 Tax=Undibacterium sp. SXout7W TaxID=3413049 RepID=UPI003BEF8A35